MSLGHVIVLTLVLPFVFAAVAPYTVNVAVADLRSAPIPPNVSFAMDSNQQSQLLYAEAVNVLGSENDDYYIVEAVNQLMFQNGSWVPYPGFILKSALIQVTSFPTYNIAVQDTWAPIYSRDCNPMACLPSDEILQVSFGTYLRMTADLGNGFVAVLLADGVHIGYMRIASIRLLSPQPESVVRGELIANGLKLLGQYYLWGGRSAFSADMWTSSTQVTGTDCSGLVSILYKLCGYLLPRNADDIFRKTSNTTNLQPGDLLFFALPSTQHIFHVMMVATNTTIMESSFDTPGPGVIANNGTRIVSAMEKFGVPLNTLQWGQKLPHYFDSLIYWGSVL